MSTRPPQPSLADTLERFCERVNADLRLKRILQGWEPVILVEASDTGRKECLPVRDCRISGGTSDLQGASHVVHLRSSEESLIAVFAGSRSPVEAYLDGELEIFATDRDHAKLDAISLLLWEI